MQLDELKAALRAWGIATVNRYAYTKADRTTHVLTKVRDHAPGTRERADRDLVGRDGESRRRAMAKHVGLKDLNILPMWAVDPVRAANDADSPHDNPEIAVDQGIPDELRWIESAVSRLSREYPMRGLIIWTEFTVSASQTVKARMVAERYGGELSLRQYRYELQRSLDCMLGLRIAA